MPTVDLTRRLARESKPGGKDTILFDKTLPGFGLRIHPSGRKVWIVQARIDGRSRRIVIARHGEMDLDCRSGAVHALRPRPSRQSRADDARGVAGGAAPTPTHVGRERLVAVGDERRGLVGREEAEPQGAVLDRRPLRTAVLRSGRNQVRAGRPRARVPRPRAVAGPRGRDPRRRRRGPPHTRPGALEPGAPRGTFSARSERPGTNTSVRSRECAA